MTGILWLMVAMLTVVGVLDFVEIRMMKARGKYQKREVDEDKIIEYEE